MHVNLRRLLRSRGPLFSVGILTLSTTASCFSGPTEGIADPRRLCGSDSTVHQFTSSVVTEADIYIDASVSMQGYISAPGYSMPISPLQQLLQTSLLEKLSDGDLSPRLHIFGEEVNPTPLPLRELRDYVRERSKYSENRSDIVAALERAGESTASLSIIITDNAQDLEYAKEGRERRAPGFDRSAVVRTISQSLAGKGFGVWLLGAQSPFEGTYFSLLLTMNTTGAGTNRRVELTEGQQRPFYCWIVSRDWNKGRKLVADLHEDLTRFASPGTQGVPSVNAIELFPGILPSLSLPEPNEDELSPSPPPGGTGVPTDVFRVRRWEDDGQGDSLGELVFQQPRTSDIFFLLKARLTLASDSSQALLSLPLSSWELTPKPPLDLGAQLREELRHFAPPKAQESSQALTKYWELSVPHNQLLARPQATWALAIPFTLRSQALPQSYWLRAWSTDVDTTPNSINGKTLYLSDVTNTIIARNLGADRRHGCSVLLFDRE